MKYIDIGKLIADIERWRDKAKEGYNKNHYSMGRCDALAEFRNFMVSLQEEQPEVDLKIEIGHWLDKLDDKYCMLVEDYSIQDIKDTARHFYELGLDARKEENK